MNKKILVLIALLFCLTIGFADSITNYVVPSSVPLNQEVTATGLFDGNAGKENIICSFYLVDLQGNLVYRATDQYTTATGRFAMKGKILTEPKFVREQTYTLHTECGFATADANFLVAQKQEWFSVGGFNFFPQSLPFDLLYFKDTNNSISIFWWFVIVLIFAVAIWLILSAMFFKN